ncbi:methyltransferase type 12 [Actinocatenispora thailandica]|uniref:Methyltransferase type 12 n=1 Tax=Actinocatenispora thailandica TaxID=227318 RepID=A0A7R7DLT4_9ACTN|nr:hypothetical protein [Actinocatenispora thailandica]BCJ33973.1 methyltransferase type 12 [Actinocatenispora thailandica]
MGWDKKSFDEIYHQPDPRAYFATLGPLDYQIPTHGSVVFRRLASLLARDDRPVTVLDLCCSYGLTAALLNHDLTLDDLRRRYAQADLAGLSPDALMRADREYFAARRTANSVRVIGVDASAPALRYATGAGLLDEAFAENLEDQPASDPLRAAADGADLVTVTGGIGYITSHTFERLLRRRDAPPWVAAFTLRTVGYEPIAAVLDRCGLVTERLADRTFKQRRFFDDQEQRSTLEALAGAGVDPTGREADGWYHTEFYLSRPAGQAPRRSVASLVAP